MTVSNPKLHPAAVKVLILTAVFVTLNLLVFGSHIHHQIHTGGAPVTNETICLPSGAVYSCYSCNAAESLWIRLFYQGQPVRISGEFPYAIQAGYRYYSVRGQDPSEVLLAEKPRTSSNVLQAEKPQELIIAHSSAR